MLNDKDTTTSRNGPTGATRYLYRSGPMGASRPTSQPCLSGSMKPPDTEKNNMVLKPTNKRPRTQTKNNQAKRRKKSTTLITDYFLKTKRDKDQPLAQTTSETNYHTTDPSTVIRHPPPATNDNHTIKNTVKITPKYSKLLETKEDLIEITKTKPTKMIPSDMIYTNLQHKKAALSTLSSNLSHNQTPIVFICEPYTNSRHNIPTIHKDMVTFKPNTTTERPRVAMSLHKVHAKTATVVEEITNRDTITIRLTKNNDNLLLSTIYMDGQTMIDNHLETIHKLNRTAKQYNARLIINTDSNSHNKIWQDKKTDKRGEKLATCIAQESLNLLNTGHNHTFENSRLQKSNIDLTITNISGKNSIHDWKISNEFTNSDHKYIRARIDLLTKEFHQFKDEKNTNWIKFQKELEENHTLNRIRKNKPNNKAELDENTATLNKIIIDTWNKNTDYTYYTTKLKPPSWQNKDIKKQTEITRKKLNTHRKQKTDSSKAELTIENAKLNKMIRSSKKEEWKKFTESIENTKQAARINKICRKHGTYTQNLDNIKKEDGTYTMEATETLKVMQTAHYGNTTVNTTNPISFADRENKIKFTLKRVHQAIASMKPNKAPGPDKITANMLQKAQDSLAGPLINIFQSSFDIGQTPDIWKLSKGIFIPKPGKTDYKNPKSFRTITLAPIMLKIQERLIQWELEDNMIDTLLDKKQFGFRKSHSTEAALHKIVHKIEKRIRKKQFALGVFLDIEGAFDKISFEAIQRGLIEKGIDPKIINWIMNMTTTRSLHIEHKGESITFRIQRGVAQGGILSPLLWNIILDDLLASTASKTPTYIQAFADDLISLAEGDDLAIIHHRTQKTLNHINEWCKKQGLKLSTIKTTIVMFTNKLKWKLKPIKIDGITIKISKSAKFLGITLDNKLNFNEHVKNISSRAKTNMIRATLAIGPTWGLSPKIALWIYKQTIRPAIIYAAPIWINALNNSQNKKTLRSAQKLALRIATGTFPNTAGPDLDILTNTDDIIFHIEKAATQTTERLIKTKKWTTEKPNYNKQTHTQKCNELLKNLNLDKETRDSIQETKQANQYHCTIDLEDGTNNTDPEEITTIYTDGSKDQSGQVGIGIYNKKHNINIAESLPNHCTVFQAEIKAITRAAETFIDIQPKTSEIHIRSDSAASINALKNNTTYSLTVLKCKEQLNKLASTNTVRIRWVKAHIGIEGNETADKLAKEGCQSQITHKMPIPNSEIKKKTNQISTERTLKHHSKHGGKYTKSIIQDMNDWSRTNKQMRYIINSRKKYRTAIQLITGIGPYNWYLYKINKSSTTTCPLCEEANETAKHLICECTALTTKRNSVIGTFQHSNYRALLNNNLLKAIKIAKTAEDLKTKNDSS